MPTWLTILVHYHTHWTKPNRSLDVPSWRCRFAQTRPWKRRSRGTGRCWSLLRFGFFRHVVIEIRWINWRRIWYLLLRFWASTIEEGIEEARKTATGWNRLFYFFQIVIDFWSFGFGFNEPIFVLWIWTNNFCLSPCSGFDRLRLRLRLRPVQCTWQKLRFRRGKSSASSGAGFGRARAGKSKVTNVSKFFLIHPLVDHASSSEFESFVVLCSAGGDALFCSDSGFLSVENEVVFRLGVGFVDGTVDSVEKRGRERGVFTARTTALLEVVWISGVKGVIPQVHGVFLSEKGKWKAIKRTWREREWGIETDRNEKQTKGEVEGFWRAINGRERIMNEEVHAWGREEERKEDDCFQPWERFVMSAVFTA